MRRVERPGLVPPTLDKRFSSLRRVQSRGRYRTILLSRIVVRPDALTVLSIVRQSDDTVLLRQPARYEDTGRLSRANHARHTTRQETSERDQTRTPFFPPLVSPLLFPVARNITHVCERTCSFAMSGGLSQLRRNTNVELRKFQKSTGRGFRVETRRVD